MDADAFEFRNTEKDGKPLLELWREGDDYGVAAFRDGRAALYLVGTVGVVAPSGFEGVAEILVLRACQILVIYAPLNVEPTYRVGLTFAIRSNISSMSFLLFDF